MIMRLILWLLDHTPDQYIEDYHDRYEVGEWAKVWIFGYGYNDARQVLDHHDAFIEVNLFRHLIGYKRSYGDETIRDSGLYHHAGIS